jgi:hypothetical protein
MMKPVENISSTRVVKAPFHMFTVRAAGKDGNVGGEIGGMGMPDPAVDPGGVHVQRVGVAQRLGRQRTKALLLVPYAVVLLAMNGVPRSLMEASKASLTKRARARPECHPSTTTVLGGHHATGGCGPACGLSTWGSRRTSWTWMPGVVGR